MSEQVKCEYCGHEFTTDSEKLKNNVYPIFCSGDCWIASSTSEYECDEVV